MKRLLCLLALLLITCSKDAEVLKVETYNLKVTANPAIGGLVNPQSGTYNSGETVTILASPNQYYDFAGWSGDWNGSSKSVTITMDSNKTITGNFEKNDLDEDGVLNINDLCPSTNGTDVDSEGCALYQKDSDEDGVTDNIDQCPNDGINGSLMSDVGCKVDLFYLGSNGITIIAIEEAEIGMVDTINDKEYIIVDNESLKEYIDEANDYIPENLVTSKVTDMSYLFQEKTIYNTGILREWDVSNVENFEGMFKGIRPLYTNYPYDQLFVDTWDTSSAINMNSMFEDTRDIGVYEVGLGYKSFVGIENWDVSNVEQMMYMFSSSSFNQPIGNWDVGNVWNMNGMFNDSQFNQPIGDWDVSNVIIMNAMFMYGSFDQPIGDWDVSKVGDMSNMFFYGFGQPTQQQISSNVWQSIPPDNPFNQDLSSWDTSNVTNMSQMFQGSLMNQDLSSWNVNNVGACTWFAKNTPNWTLPKPNFINCSVDPD